MIDLKIIRLGNRRAKNKAIQELYRYCVERLCRRKISQAIAEDCCQEGFMVFMQKAMTDAAFQLEGDVRYYVYRICLNKYFDYLRTQKQIRMVGFISREVQDTLDDSLDELERKEIIEQVMVVFEQKLKEDCQVILRAFYFERKPLKEIALIRNVTPSSIKTQKSRCLGYLRKMIVDVDQINKAV